MGIGFSTVKNNSVRNKFEKGQHLYLRRSSRIRANYFEFFFQKKCIYLRPEEVKERWHQDFG